MSGRFENRAKVHLSQNLTYKCVSIQVWGIDFRAGNRYIGYVAQPRNWDLYSQLNFQDKIYGY